MKKSYVIQWKSRINGRAGRGTNRFSLNDAENLAAELNREYPGIHHEIVDLGSSPSGAPPNRSEPVHEVDAPAEEPLIARNPGRELAFR